MSLQASEDQLRRLAVKAQQADEAMLLRQGQIALRYGGEELAPSALCCLALDNPLRRLCIAIYRSPWFDRCVLLLILANTCILALADPLVRVCLQPCARYCSPSHALAAQDEAQTSARARVVEWGDLVINVLFTVELLIKFVAKGVVRYKTAFMRDAWNRFDFVIVLLGCVVALPLASLPSRAHCNTRQTPLQLAALCVADAVRRLLRERVGAARAARAQSAQDAQQRRWCARPAGAVPRCRPAAHPLTAGLRILVKALLDSAPSLANVVLLQGFIFFIYAVIGMQFFGGKLRQQCLAPDTGAVLDEEDRCATHGMGLTCPTGYVCSARDLNGSLLENPESGLLAFDNVLLSLLTIFSSVSLEGWWDVMHLVRAAAALATAPAPWLTRGAAAGVGQQPRRRLRGHLLHQPHRAGILLRAQPRHRRHLRRAPSVLQGAGRAAATARPASPACSPRDGAAHRSWRRGSGCGARWTGGASTTPNRARGRCAAAACLTSLTKTAAVSSTPTS